MLKLAGFQPFLPALLGCTAGIAAAQSADSPQPLAPVVVTSRPAGTLTVPDTEQATAAIERTPGAVSVIPDTAFKTGSARTVQDVLGGVPGIVTQSRWGPDARLSIRGSGLSRSYGNRGVNLSMDGIPINTADGLFDLFEVDPSAYRYVEVFKGANALRYGANALGGALNFVTPTGRDADRFDGRFDAGSFGHGRLQASTGGARGAGDHFVTASAETWDGYRDHSEGELQRMSGNVGLRLSPDLETRFYVNLNRWRSRLPGEVTKAAALGAPRDANPYFVLLDQQRNIDSQRLANKTTWRNGSTTWEFGGFGVHRHVKHPIYQWLDFEVDDFGGFVRATDDRTVGGHRNRVVAGVNVHNGAIDHRQYVNRPGAVKGDLAASTLDTSRNLSVYAEDAFSVRPDLALVAGAQYQRATRSREDRFLADGDQSGRQSHGHFSPKLGVLWDVGPTWQVFANVSRSAEVPTFDVNTFAGPASSRLEAQTATTHEVGTRGRQGELAWDLAVYRAVIRGELQCLANAASPGACTVRNAGRTVHQGVEAGLDATVLKSVVAPGDRVRLAGAYTYNDFRFDGDAAYGDNVLPGVPRHSLRAELLYRTAGGFFAGPNVEWVPKAYFADNANRVTVDRYALLNLKVGLDDLRAGWSAYLEGRNVLDRRYIASTVVVETADASSELFSPGTGRTVHAGARFRW